LCEGRSSFCRGANTTTDNTGTQRTRQNITNCICMLREYTLKATCKGRTMDRSPGPVCLPAKLSSAKRLPYMLRHPVPSPCSSCQGSLLQYSAAASSRAAQLRLLEQRNTPSAPLQSPHPAHKAACLATEPADWVTPDTVRRFKQRAPAPLFSAASGRRARLQHEVFDYPVEGARLVASRLPVPPVAFTASQSGNERSFHGRAGQNHT